MHKVSTCTRVFCHHRRNTIPILSNTIQYKWKVMPWLDLSGNYIIQKAWFPRGLTSSQLKVVLIRLFDLTPLSSSNLTFELQHKIQKERQQGAPGGSIDRLSTGQTGLELCAAHRGLVSLTFFRCGALTQGTESQQAQRLPVCL